MDRARQVEEGFLPRVEELGVHAPGPAPHVPEAAPRQILLQARRRHHHPARRRVEAPQGRIAHGQRQADPRLHIFGEAGVEGGGEGQAAAQAIAPRRHAQRPLRRDMDGAGLKGIDQARQAPPRQHRQADLGIGRAGKAREQIRGDHLGLVAELAQLIHRAHQRAHDAVHLRQPGVRNDDDAHQLVARLSIEKLRRLAHSRISSLPSACSTRAVQLSTQSPSLQ